MEKIRLVMDMVETPEKYSEFQVNSILQDEECRQIYLTMMEMRMAFDKNYLEKNLNLDHEWQKNKSKSSTFESSLAFPQVEKDAQEMLDSNLDSTNSVGRFIPNTHKIKDVAFLKMVASFVGVLLLSAVAFAAIHTFFPHHDDVSGWQEIKKQDNLLDVISQTMDYGDSNGPEYEANLYYAGTIGKLKIDFDASYLWRKAISRMMETENANHLDCRLIHTCNNSRNQMLAGKLVLSLLVGKGTVEFGGEIASTHSRESYVNDKKYVAPSSTLVNENNVASFFTWRYPLGDLAMVVGLRYEYVNTNYYSFGEYQAEPSRSYGNWFPNFSLSWNKGLWNASLNYICKTSRPSYNNLRSEIQYNNRYLYEGGNPYLRPSISNDVSLDMVYSWFSFGLEYEYLDKPMMWYGSLYDGKNIAFVHYLNFSCKHELSFYAVASPKLGWYNPTLQIFLVKPFMGRAGEHAAVSLDNPSLVATWNNKIAFSSPFTGWLTIRGNTYSCQDFVRLKPAYSMSVRMVKTFFLDALKLNLYASDLFGTQKDKWMMYGDDMTLAKDAYNYTREVGLQVSYTFNAMKSKYKGSGAGASEKERLRI